jgi:hypothetical protein
MSTRKIISFSAADGSELVDVELPGDIPLRELMPDLLKTLFQDAETREIAKFVLLNEEGEPLDLKKTLEKNEIRNSETISIETETLLPTLPSTTPKHRSHLNNQRKQAALPDQEPSIKPVSEVAKDRRGQLHKAGKQEFKVEHPCLLFDHEDQAYIFILGNPLSSIGRPKGNYKPDIDLSEIDIDRISSRPHAEIEKKDSSYILRALKTTNEMFVNGAEMDFNETRVLEDNDVLQFGFQGVKLVFRLPKPSKNK